MILPFYLFVLLYIFCMSFFKMKSLIHYMERNKWRKCFELKIDPLLLVSAGFCSLFHFRKQTYLNIIVGCWFSQRIVHNSSEWNFLNKCTISLCTFLFFWLKEQFYENSPDCWSNRLKKKEYAKNKIFCNNSVVTMITFITDYRF